MRAKCEACAHCKVSDGRGLAEKEKKKVGKEKAERGRTPDAVHRVAFSEASAFTSTLCGADDKRIPPCFAEQVAEHLNFLDTRAAGKKKNSFVSSPGGCLLDSCYLITCAAATPNKRQHLALAKKSTFISPTATMAHPQEGEDERVRKKNAKECLSMCAQNCVF